ncbi:MAG: dTMP kinase [Candidatus Dojkabacteria bacterium]
MFIVFDSIDGGGKGFQRERVLAILHEKGLQVKGEEFPIHNAFYETVIHPALQEITTLNKASWVLSFLLDKTLAADEINDYVGNSEKHFIADGYFTTTIAYQGFLTEQVSIDKLLSYAKDFDIPKPDIAIYLDVDPEIAYKRKEQEEGHDEGLDMFEKSIEKQKKLREIYKKMVNEQIYCKWVEVDGNGSPEEVTDAIIAQLKKVQVLN